MENKIIDNSGSNLLVNGVLFVGIIIVIFIIRLIFIKLKKKIKK